MGDPHAEDPFWLAAENATRFFMGTAEVHLALRALAKALDELDIPYAIAGAMALNEYGYERVTKDVDVLLTSAGLSTFKRHLLGRGYVEKFEGSKGLRDTEHNVLIDVLIAGDYPGDGKPKPVQFPDPAEIAERRRGAAFLPLPTLIELKLASGISAPHRVKDLADVLELIRMAHLPRELEAKLNPYVRSRYLELWDAAQIVDPE